MEKGIVAIIMALALVAIVPIAAYGQQIPFAISNRATLGGAQQIVSEIDGTTIWNFRIHATDTNIDTEKSLRFELIMEGKDPVYPTFQIIDNAGFTKALLMEPVVPGVIVNSLDDLTPILTEPVPFGMITSDDFYTIQLMIFKDEARTVLYENGYIMTMLYGSMNCYQVEYQCLNSLRGNYQNVDVLPLPWGWNYNKDDSTKPTWSYLSHDEKEMAQGVMARIEKEEAEKPAVPPVQLQNVPTSLAFGQTINVGITGPFVATTAMLFHIDQNSNVKVVAVDQASEGTKTSINFPIPSGPQGNYQPGDYRLEISVMDKDGHKHPFIYKYTVAP